MSLKKILSLMVVDLKMWFRQPKLLLMAVIPLIIISLGVGFFMADVEILPVGIVVESQDENSLELKEYIMNLQSGSGALWFEATDENVDEKFENGEILGKITIPSDLSERLENGEQVAIEVYINNINEDVTKNFIQRLQNALNYFNDNLVINEEEYQIPRVTFYSDVSPDLKLIQYLCASVLGLTILLSASTAIAFSIAREFEDNTIKELIMGPKFSNILVGKIFSATVQTLIVSLFILAEERLIFGFFPANILEQIIYIVGGVIISAGIAIIVAVKSKQVLPAGIIVMVLNIGGWWLAGGLAPAEAWTGLLRTLADWWPGTYFYQTYINSTLLGSVDGSLLLHNSIIVLLFGFAMLWLASLIFEKEAKEI